MKAAFVFWYIVCGLLANSCRIQLWAYEHVDILYAYVSEAGRTVVLEPMLWIHFEPVSVRTMFFGLVEGAWFERTSLVVTGDFAEVFGVMARQPVVVQCFGNAALLLCCPS
jgi:membrane protein required for beta-lactamase induction